MEVIVNNPGTGQINYYLGWGEKITRMSIFLRMVIEFKTYQNVNSPPSHDLLTFSEIKIRLEKSYRIEKSKNSSRTEMLL